MFYFRENPWILRSVRPEKSGNAKSLFLSFDDGPDPEVTPRVLDLLQELEYRASFFVIGRAAARYPGLIQRMVTEGHSVHSHSLDHRYDLYFRQKPVLKRWILESLDQLSQQTGQAHRCFRPPAGIVTPPMVEAATELQTPLVLWTTRYFDTTRTWTEKRAMANAECHRSGDIILLHDHQKKPRQEIFLKTLHAYTNSLRHVGFRLSSLGETGLV